MLTRLSVSGGGIAGEVIAWPLAKSRSAKPPISFFLSQMVDSCALALAATNTKIKLSDNNCPVRDIAPPDPNRWVTLTIIALHQVSTAMALRGGERVLQRCAVPCQQMALKTACLRPERKPRAMIN